jgi:hypothetical protein
MELGIIAFTGLMAERSRRMISVRNGVRTSGKIIEMLVWKIKSI